MFNRKLFRKNSFFLHFNSGLKRFEVAVALANSLSLLVIGFYIVYEAVARGMDNQLQYTTK